MRQVAAATVLLGAIALLGFAQPAATVRGRLLADDTGDPIPNARVSLTPASVNTPVVLSDDDGRFTFTVPRGQHRIVVIKTGYARLEVPPTAADDVGEIRLPRGSVITGHVVDDFGDPVPSVRIVVNAAPASAANRPAVATSTTDDRGDYRIAGLPAAVFIVSVLTPGWLSLPPDARPGSANSTVFVGTLVPMYYPTATTAADAQQLRLTAGEEQSGIDFVVPALVTPGRALLFGVDVDSAAATLGTILAPPRPPSGADAAAPPPAPTGIVRGRVTTTDGVPLAHAQVRLIGSGIRPRIAYADRDGRFELSAVPPRAYAVQASKVGYSMDLSGNIWKTSFDLADGETRERTDVSLSRWGALEGHVVDERGDPIQGASVQLLQVRYEAGRRRLVPIGGEIRLTDDLGRYRLFELKPGQYIVSASVNGVASTDLPGYARAYFPGTADPSEAQFVSVGLSQEVTGVDIGLSRTRTLRVAGQLLDSTGAPTTGGRLSLMPSQRSSLVTGVPIGARILPDGRFEFPNLTPGQYVIQASRGRSQPWIEGEFGSIPVSVSDADVTGLTLQTKAGSSIAGHFVFESDTGATPPLVSIEMSPIPIDFDNSPPNNWATAEIHDDGTFEMAGINGPRRLQLLRAPPGWALREILVNRVDVTDRPLVFGNKNQSLTNVEVVLTDRVSTLTGSVLHDRNAAAGAAVIVFSTDRDNWYVASRFVRQVQTSATGEFTIAGLPFGSYYAAVVAALPDDDDEGWRDPAFLESLVPSASSLRVRDGELVSITLTF